MDKRRFKLWFSLSSFQFCRPKQPSSFPQTPLPSTLLYPPLNLKSFDISFPSFKFPDPPPSTPDHSSFIPHASPSPTHIEYNLVNENNPRRKTHSSDGRSWPSKPPQSSKNEREKHQKKKKKKKACANAKEDNHEDIEKKPTKGSTRKKSNTNVSQKASSPESVSPVIRRQTPLVVDGKATESFAVVKRSEDPYEDFKRSMLEMILEKEMFEGSDLEQLLLCFLSLNSRDYHGVIVEAFSEIWELLFHKSIEII